MTLKRIVFVSVASFLGLFIVAILYITVFIDPSDYKTEIITQVKSNTGRELLITGDISWRFLPNIGLTIGHTQINNPKGFPDEPLLEFDSASIDLAFWPLLSKKIEVGLISIKGLTINIHTRKDGVNNLDSLNDSSTTTDKNLESQLASEQNSEEINLFIEGLQVVDAKIIITDLLQNTKQSINTINLTLGTLMLGEIVPLSFSAQVETDGLNAEIQSEGHIKIAKNFQRYDLLELNTKINARGKGLPGQAMTVSSTVTGYYNAATHSFNFDALTLSLLGIDIEGTLSAKLTGITDIKYDFKLGDIDLDAIIEQLTLQETEENVTEEPIDLSWMAGLKVKGLVSIKSIKAKNLLLKNIRFPLEITNSQLKLSSINAQLYQGKILADVRLDARKSIPLFSAEAKLSDVQALPLVKDFLEKELISGDLNLSFKIKGKGLDQASLRKNTQGNGEFAFTDGAILGVNVAQLIRSGYATLKGQATLSNEEPLQTDFASFNGSFTLADGFIRNTDLQLLSPLLRITGKGHANIIDETVNYRLKTAVVGTLEGQGGVPITELKKVSIPLKIQGPMANPKISVDMKDLLKENLKESLKDKLMNKLKGLWGT